jgi:hypothetical protein
MAEIDEAPLFTTGTTRAPEQPYFGAPEEAPLFKPAAPPQPTTFPKEQYEKMPWRDVLSRAGQQLVPSAARSLSAIPSAIYNYPETGRAIKELGLGAAGRMGLYEEKDPEARARQAQMVETMVEPFTSVGGFKKTLAEDPYAILSAAATPFGGGLAKAGELVGATSMAGRTLGGLGKAARYAMDPTQAAMGTVGDVAGYGLEKIRGIRDISTNVPRYSYEKAFEAGALPEGNIAKQAFKDFASGQGDAIEFSQRARKATEALKNQAMENWIATKGQMTGAATQDIPFDRVEQAIRDARARLGPQDLALDPTPYQTLDLIENNLAQRAALPSGHPGRTLEGFDQLKQQLYNYAKTQGNTPSGSVAMNVHSGVKNAINDVAPEYQALMDHYQAIDDQIQNIQKQLGTSNRTAANAEMAKFIKSQNTPEGRALINQLAQHDPVLPFMSAGSAVHSATATGIPGGLEKASLPLHALNIATGVLSANPFHALSAMGLAGAQTALQSPSLMGDISYKAGQLGATQAARAARKVPSAVRTVQPVATQLVRIRPEIESEVIGSVTPMEEEAPYFPGPGEERRGRATGGFVRRGMTADQLIAAADRAKKQNQQTSKKILDAPDEHVAKALEIANQNI